jgi:hypothetical protein
MDDHPFVWPDSTLPIWLQSMTLNETKKAGVFVAPALREKPYFE